MARKSSKEPETKQSNAQLFIEISDMLTDYVSYGDRKIHDRETLAQDMNFQVARKAQIAAWKRFIEEG